jgi:hypothetical protein
MKAFSISFVSMFCAFAVSAQNIVVNGDFSQVKDGRPLEWETSGSPENVEQKLEAGNDDAGPFAKLVCTKCINANGWSHAMIAQVGKVKLEKDKLYEFSCRVKAENIEGRLVSVAISDTKEWQNCGLSAGIPLAENWTSFKTVFKASRTVSDVTRLQFWYTEPGTFYLAGVRIVEAPKTEIEFTDVIPATDSKNLIPNASFECGKFGWSSLGQNTGWGNLSELCGSIVSGGDAPHGRNFLRISLGGDKTPVLYFDYLKAVVRREIQPLAANLRWIAVEKDQTYSLSCYMRSDSDGIPAFMGVRLRDAEGSPWSGSNERRKVTLTKQWQRYTMTFKPSKRYVFVTVGPALETEQAVTVDIDAVQLEKGGKASDFSPRSTVEVGMEPSAASGIFTEGESNFLRLVYYDNEGSGRKPGVKFELSDFFGEKVALPEQKNEDILMLPDGLKGYCLVKTSCESDSNFNGRSFPLAIVQKQGCNDTAVGVNHAFVNSALIQSARKAGVTWYRDWSLKWQDLEPKRGEFHWEIGDAQIDRVLAEKVKLMALLPPFPSAEWNSEAPENIPAKANQEARVRQAWAPKDADELGRFVGQAVSQYGKRVRTWEFLNEPVYTSYALPGKDHAEYKKYGAKNYEVKDYVGLLKISFDAMKKSDPECKVIGGIAGGPDNLALEAISKGCLDSCDIFNLHIYPGSQPPEGFIPNMKRLVAAMDAAGKRRPIWITEFSYYGSDTYSRRPFIPDAGNWAEERMLKDEKQCADYTIRFYTIMMSFGVEKIFIHSGASGSVNSTQPECCLFDYGAVPKKIFPALAVFSGLMGTNAKFAKSEQLGKTAYSYSFTTENGVLSVAWESSENSKTSIQIPDDDTCYDIMGKIIKGKQVVLGGSPVYILKRKQ